ncbi:MAG: hypothetical protein ACXWQ5_18330 [Ktedonobacterales bacterium]
MSVACREDTSQRVDRTQRFSREQPCPICGGWQSGPKGSHCYGFMSASGTAAICTEVESPHRVASGYLHRLAGSQCACGVAHDITVAHSDRDPERRSSGSPKPKKRDLHALIPSSLRDSWHQTAQYRYCDAGGTLRYVIVRFDPPADRANERKRCLPFQPVDGKWACDMEGAEKLLYALPELVAADASRKPVFVTEGEKCADALRAVGLTATCNVGGAKKWRLTPGRHDVLRNRHVVVLPDADEPGKEHARDIVDDLTGIAASIRLIELPGLEDDSGQDVADWLSGGHTAIELLEIVATTPALEPGNFMGVSHEVEAEHFGGNTPRIEPAQQPKSPEERAEERWERRLLQIPSQKLSATHKAIAKVLRDEFVRERVPVGQAHETRIWHIAKSTGVSRQTAGEAVRKLAECGLITRSEDWDECTQQSRVVIGPTALFETPERIEPPTPRNHGGRRVCQHCGGTHFKVKHTIVCMGCGGVIEHREHEIDTVLDEDHDEDHDELHAIPAEPVHLDSLAESLLSGPDISAAAAGPVQDATHITLGVTIRRHPFDDAPLEDDVTVEADTCRVCGTPDILLYTPAGDAYCSAHAAPE